MAMGRQLFLLMVFMTVVNGQTPGDGDLRLNVGQLHGGMRRLEVFHEGTWGSVCDDGFGPEEAGVACWQMGFGRHGNNFSTIGVDTATVPILLDDLDCQGNESRLEQCQHRPWGQTDCKDVEHVALSCQNDPCRNSPCLNGATCVAVDDVNVTCLCTSSTTGKLCENYINFCEVDNGGCSHVCNPNLTGPGYACACPDDFLQLNTDEHTCYAPTVEVRCGRTMEVAFPRAFWAGLHEEYLTLTNSSCVATGNNSHISLSVPLYTCGTVSKVLDNGFVFENQAVTHLVPVAGLVSRVRELNMTIRCHYDNDMLLDNWYIVNNGEINFSEHAQGHYQLNMDLFHNGKEYEGGLLEHVTPGENLSIRLSLMSNDSHLQVFARNCKATPTAHNDPSSQFLFLKDGCSNDTSLVNNHTLATQETLQLTAFKFQTANSSSLLMNCDVVVCNVTDPSNPCTRGCLTGNDARDAADEDPEEELGDRVRRDVEWEQVTEEQVLSNDGFRQNSRIEIVLWFLVSAIFVLNNTQ